MNQKLFCYKYSFKMIFIFFVLGCLIGTYYEELLYFFTHQIYTNRQGLIFGPFSPIYGIGFANFIIFLGAKNKYRGILKTWFLCFLIAGITEYLESFIFDKVFNIEFWNYTGYFLNIHGRTTIPFMIGWGFGGMILLKIIYPWLYKITTKIPTNLISFSNIIYYAICIFFLLDIIITYSALGRMTLRNKGIEAQTFIGEFYDQVYDDEYLKKKFPAMKKADYK